MKFSPRVWAVVAAGLIGTGSQLGAQQVPFAGATYGCFITGSATSCNPTASATDLFLAFAQGTFNTVTAPDGTLNLNTAANNLGTMTLGNTPASYSGKFLLQIIFALPTLTSSNAVYMAAIFGRVLPNGFGGVNIIFQNPTQTFAFNGPQYTGTFDLTVNNIDMNTQGPRMVTGFITTSVAPEPGTTALLATGLMGLVPMARMRRRKKQVD
jgi:hypothetical protein